MSTDNPASDSSYPPFKAPPKLESQIPEHLLTSATPFEKHVMGELSIMRQMNDWTVRTLADTNDYVRRTNGKVNRHEAELATIRSDVDTFKQDKQTVVGGWKAIIGFCAVIAGVFGFVLSIYSAIANK